MSRIEEHFEPFPVLETERTRLRPISYLDMDDMYSYCSVPEVSRYTTWDYHKGKEDTHAFIDFVVNRYESAKVGPWGIELKESNKLIGSCGYVNWDNYHLRAEIGYVISNQYWNKGMTTEVVKKIIAFSFQELGLIRVKPNACPIILVLPK